MRQVRPHSKSPTAQRLVMRKVSVTTVTTGWTKGEGKCSSVTTSLTQTESASVLHFVYTDLVPSSVVKTRSRRQSGLVCSLLVVSLLLSAAVGEGELSDLGVAVCT